VKPPKENVKKHKEHRKKHTKGRKAKGLSESSVKTETSETPIVTMSTNLSKRENSSSITENVSNPVIVTTTTTTDSSYTLVSSNRKSVADFEFTSVLGQGTFGEVRLARDIHTGKEYAAKLLDKKFIIESGKKKYVHTERNIYNLMSHPNIVKLSFTFQDPKTLYYILELCPNGHLGSHLKRIGRFSEECTRFYAAEIINALEHMHSKSVIHRDLKPDNVLLDPNFHAKLTDFGTSKELGNDSRVRAESFCGTEEYVSPELLNENEPCCFKSSDLWALGCIVFQMLSGKVPFKGETGYQTFQLIQKGHFECPDYFSSSAVDLIQKLLCLDPHQRLGAGENGYAALKAHPFFNGISFETIHCETPPKMIL